MSASSPTIAAMRMGVAAIERRHGFEEAVANLLKAREEAQRLAARRETGPNEPAMQPVGRS